VSLRNGVYGGADEGVCPTANYMVNIAR
jgi:hypothetical protein